MNVSLRRNLFFLIFLIFLLPYEGKAQNFEEVDVSFTAIQGETTIYSFVSTPIDPFIAIQPTQGGANLVELSNTDYELHYTPNSGVVGDDYIRLIITKLTGPAPVMVAVNITVNVVPSEVIAFDDFGVTSLNTAISIDVLANDFVNTTNGTLNVSSTPVVNNGSLNYSGNSPFIEFTPRPGFEGLTHFSYVVCDDQGACDEATVSILVLGDQSNIADTMRIFTHKNTIKNVFVPLTYNMTTSPLNGTFQWNDDIPTYEPNPDYTGMDYIGFEYNGVDKIVEIFVLDHETNTHAVDDVVYTTSYQPVEFNVLENDGYGTSSGCFNIVSGPSVGTLEQSFPDGNLIYTPIPGYSGVDKFTYAVSDPACDGEAEIATVVVYVNNFEPNATKYYLSTPKKTPLIIGYNVPIKDFNFEIVDQGELGDVFFMEGQQDTVLYGQTISGYNLIIYNPDPSVVSGTDQFEIKYCVMDDGNCVYEQAIKIDMDILDIGDGSGPLCFDDCIWSGDTNFDGIVNMQDLLPLGIGAGKMGVPRQNVDLSQWYGQYGADWDLDYKEDLVNFKHLDTDGDSLITGLDTVAISDFYGNTHSLAPNLKPYYGFQIKLEGNIYAEPGEEIELDMSIGSYESPVFDVYGFTFPFNYNPDLFVAESVKIDFQSGSWLTYNSAVLTMTKNLNNGLAEAGFTRTDGNKVSGFGIIGSVSIVIEVDIDGFRDDDGIIPVTIGGGSATVFDANGNPFQVSVDEFTINIIVNGNANEGELTSEGLEEINADDELSIQNGGLLEEQLLLYPNPARNELNVRMTGGQEYSELVVRTVTGQEVLSYRGQATEQSTLQLGNLSNGIYIISVYTNNGLITKKFEILK